MEASDRLRPASHGGTRLNQRQRDFAREYVLSGGNALAAASAARYASTSMANKSLLHAGILQEIKRLSVVNIQAELPRLIRNLLDIALDPEVDPKSRILATNSLLDRSGAGVQRATAQQPSVAVQVNVGGQEATALIRQVWESKRAREKAQAIVDGAGEEVSEDAH